METSVYTELDNVTEPGAGTLCATIDPLSDLGCINTYKVDSQIFSTMITSGVAGLLCLAAFCVLQTFVSVYRGRLLSPQVAIKPPIYTGNGIAKYFYWIWATISLKEKELLATAGMDALILERLIVFGLQLMAPITVASCAVLIPVHANSGYLATSTAQLQSNLMGLTMSNVAPGSSVLWLHFAFIWGYCLYAMWLLDRHYQWYVLLRQQYMTRGDSISTWLGHTLRGQPQCLRNDSILADSPELHTQRQLLDPSSGFARCTRSEQGSSAAEQLAAPPLKARTFDGVGRPGKGAQGLTAGDSVSLQQGSSVAEKMLASASQQQLPQRSSMQSAFATAAPVTFDNSFEPGFSNTSSSPADSSYTSRQSSTNRLLSTVELTKSSSQHLYKPVVTFSADAGMLGLNDEESGCACQAVVNSPTAVSNSSQKAKATGFAQRLRSLGSSRSHMLSKGYEELDQQQAWQLRREQEQQRQAAAVAAAEKLGADIEWWAFNTGDPLLDKHVVQVDVAGDLAWADSPDPETGRLHLWWELAPAQETANKSREGAADRVSAASAQLSGHSKPTSMQDMTAAGSSFSALPGTRLLFDRRSLRARKPSVRFRNTVHVRGLSGQLLPLHVSNYAVLVTDVPGGDGGYIGEEEEEHVRDVSPRPGCLVRLLQAGIWGWPCLLSQEDLTDLSSTWNTHSFRAKSMQFSSNIQQLMRQRFQQPEEDQAEELQAPDQQAGCSRQHVGAEHSILSSVGQHQISDRHQLVEKTFRQLFQDELHAVVPVRNFQAVDELLRQWDRDLQQYIHNKAIFQLRVEQEGWSGPGSVLPHQMQPHRTPSQSTLEAATGSSVPCSPTQVHGPNTHHHGYNSDREVQQSSTGAEGPAESSLYPQQQAQAVSSIGPVGAAGHCGGDGQELHISSDPARCQPHCSLSLEVHQTSSSSSGEPCRTPKLAPLRPRPVIPHHVMTKPRFVTRDEGEGATVIGKCCSAVVDILASGRAEDSNDEDSSTALSVIAERLEDQQQALVDLEASILEAQKEVLKASDTGSFIVLFKTPAAATLAAHSSVFPQSSNSLEAFKVQPAPSPEDILWQNLWKTPAAKRDESIRCLFWYALVYLVPTGIFTAALNSISYSICNSQTVGPRMDWFCHSHFLQFLFTIILPMVLLMLWQNAVIPAYFYKLELRRGAAVSLSEMERNILFIYVGWELVNLFLGGVLSASLTSQIKMLTDNPDRWAMLLGAAFPNSSNFFLNYVIARAFMMNLFRLIMPHGGMWRWIGQMLFTGAASFNHAATERYRAFIIYPASIRYGREPGLILLILLMGVAYSVAAPLITPFVLAYFCTAYLVWRYLMIYVCVRCYESGGKMWPAYFVIILWCLGLFVVFSSCILIFKQANLQGVLVLPLLPLMYMFARYCGYSYSSRVDHPPLWLAHEAPRTEIDPLVYTPPCLQPHAQGWYFEMGKAWVRWGAPAYLDPNI